jgi:uncharacterized protein
VILLDANLLLYAVDESSPRHRPAKRWLEDRLSGLETVAFAWSVLSAVLRISTRRGIFQNPLTTTQAFDLVERWLAQPVAILLHPTERHLAVLRGLLEPLGTAGNLVGDAHLAALAIEHGALLVSCDTDFARFSGLRWLDPLAAP